MESLQSPREQESVDRIGSSHMNSSTQRLANAPNSSKFKGREASEGSSFDLTCINLLCKIESLMSEVRGRPFADRIETASTTANAILLQLLEFSDDHFEDDQAASLQVEVCATLECRKAHEEAFRKRSWAYAFKSLLSSNAIDPVTIEAYDKLGKSLRCTCGVVFTEMLKIVRSDSQVRSQINQSSVVLLEELKSVWL